MKLFSLCLMLLLLATTAHARDELSGVITTIDPSNGTLEISGVKIVAKDADVQGVFFPGSLDKFKIGDKVEIEGEFTGPRQMKATKVERKIFRHYEIEASLDKADPGTRILEISGITIKVPGGITIEDLDDNPTSIAKLSIGQRVEVEGSWTGTAEFTADKIEMRREKQD